MVLRKTKHIWEQVGTVEQDRQSMHIQKQRDGITSMLGVGSEDRDQGSRIGGDMSMSKSVGCDRGKGMSMGMGKSVGSADSAPHIDKVRRKPGPKEHSASEGDAHPTGALTPF